MSDRAGTPRAVVALIGPMPAAEVAAAVARRLSGPTVVLPYDALLHDWIARPADAGAVRSVAAQQLKLLVAGYVRAGYHVVVHGAFARDGVRDYAAAGQMLRLMQTVPGVAARAVLCLDAADAAAPAAPPVMDLRLDPRRTSVEQAATAIWESLPPGM